MDPTHTYILNIKPTLTTANEIVESKEQMKAWLTANGFPIFLEASLEGDFWPEENEISEAIKELETNNSPLQVYEYSKEKLVGLKNNIELRFGKKIYTCFITDIKTEAWQTGWKDFFSPIYTEHFVVLPPWLEKKDQPEEFQKLQLMVIEPGAAFGTGQHETTYLCLKAVEKYFADNKKQPPIAALDVGTGTGILAIACAYFDSKPIIATDIDQDSLKATETNVLLNKFMTKKADIELELGSIPKSENQFDLILANILKQPLLDLMPDFVKKLNPGGQLILSGFLSDNVEELKDCAMQNQLSYVSHQLKNNWACLVVQKS